MSARYNTTDNQYQGKAPAMKAAQALANKLRDKYTFKGEDADLNDAAHVRWLDEIVVFEDWNGAPAVIFETDTEWAFDFGFNTLRDLGHDGYYFEPYYSFAVNIFAI